MKTITSALAILLISFSSFTFANSDKNASSINVSKERISEIIKSEITFPDSLTESVAEGVVAVSFTFNSENDLVITNMNYSNESLRNYVATQLSKISIFNANQFLGVNFNLKFNFLNQ